MPDKKPQQISDGPFPAGFQLLHTLRGHKEEIRRIAWSPDGKMLASPSSDKTVRIWNTEKGELFGVLRADNAATVYCVAWSPDSKVLASGSSDNLIRLWDCETGEMIRSLVGHEGWVNALAWSPDGKRLASGSEDATIRLWSMSGGGNSWRPLVISAHAGNVNALAWSPDGHMLASGSGDHTIRLWNKAGKLLRTLEGHSDWVFTLSWFPDGKTLASGSWDGTIRRWNAKTGKKISMLEAHTSSIGSISVSFDGRLLASKGDYEKVWVWRCDNWETVALLHEPKSDRSSPSLAFHPSLPILATLDEEDRSIRIWQLDYKLLLGAATQSDTMHYRNAKIVLTGDTGVGKSGLALVLTAQQFQPTDSTHGRNIYTFDKHEEILPGGQKELREMLLWDTAGQPAYRLIHQLHLNEVSVALVVFDSRSETEPFAGVRHWERALRQAHGIQGNASIPLKKFLVAARVDRGGVSASTERIEATVRELGFDDYFQTSAREGWGISELAQAIRDAIDWNALPKVTSTELFNTIRQFLITEKKAGGLLSPIADLYRGFRLSYPSFDDDAELRTKFDTCIGFMENHRLLRRLSFGGLVLLQSEILDSYASSIINAARAEPDGLGAIAEEDVLNARFELPRDERVQDRDQEKLLLIATVEELLRHEIGFKENTDLSADLVFPSQFTRERPGAPDVPNKTVVFVFEGPVLSIYATLAVRLSRSRLFQKKEMWRNAATFEATVKGICGVYLSEPTEGQGELALFFNEEATEAVRYQFEDYVAAHLERRAIPGSIKRRRIITCPVCAELIPDSMVNRRLGLSHTKMRCPVCESEISLLDRDDRLTLPMASVIVEMDKAADSQRDLDTAATIIRGKRESDDYDVFLCHNSQDKESVKEIGERLKEQGILPWLDEWNLMPGWPWQRALEQEIQKIRSAAVFVGKSGIGPWQQEEIEAFLNQFVERKCSVIPVLLAEAPETPKLPLFLRNRTWVDFRKYNPDPMEWLIWGITGERHHKLK